MSSYDGTRIYSAAGGGRGGDPPPILIVKSKFFRIVCIVSLLLLSSEADFASIFIYLAYFFMSIIQATFKLFEANFYRFREAFKI